MKNGLWCPHKECGKSLVAEPKMYRTKNGFEKKYRCYRCGKGYMGQTLHKMGLIKLKQR